MSRLRLSVCLLLVLVIAAIRPLEAAAPGEFDGGLPSEGGAALVGWGGGSVSQLEDAAIEGGCDLESLWVTAGGQWVPYTTDVPEFVNGSFLALHPGGEVSAKPLLLICRGLEAEIQPIAFEPAFDGQVFDQPVELVAYPGDRFLLAQRGGDVLLLDGGTERGFLDLAVRTGGSEEGLLSVALDPEFASNGHVWVYYLPADGERRTRLSRFTVSEDAAAPSSELVVLEVSQPYSNHNGGAVRFGGDGMLYLGLGDGGDGGDPHGNGQDRETLLGSVIRIDVSQATAAQPYAIPSDNPYVSSGGRGEIWAYGFRNPWRMAFDAERDRLWVADVGQSAVEEIDIVTRGGNYGWNRMEGDRCYQSGCSADGTVLPVATYGRDGGCSVTGGVVAGEGAPAEVRDAYLFADYCSGRVWAMDAAGDAEPVEVGAVQGNPTSFALGGDGAVYLVQFGGPVLRLVSP